MPPTPLMTPVRRTILAAGLPVVLIVIALAGYVWVTRTVIVLSSQSRVSYLVGLSVPPADGQARVHSSNGDLTVQTGTGRRIGVHGQLTGSFVRPTFSHRWTADGLDLDPQCHVPAGNCSLNLGLTVPARLPVSVSDSFGTLDARGLHGTVALSDNSGDLTASRLSGSLHLSDSFGTLTASGLAGSIRLDNNSGDIQAAGITGDTRLKDSFGTISVTGLAAADVVASNNSGDIYLVFTQVPRQVNVTDSFGNITLMLPPGPAAYRVQTQNSFGTTTVSVPRSPSAQNVITAHDNSGDITITTRPQPAPLTHVTPASHAALGPTAAG
jgi:Putative adhesin